MRRKLSNYIAGAFILNVFAIITVGGICTLMVRDMVRNISRLEDESTNVARIHRLNNRIQQVAFLVQDASADVDHTAKQDVNHALDKAEGDLLAYMEEEKLRQHTFHIDEELLLLDKIRDNISGIRQVLPELITASVAPTPPANAIRQLQRFAFHVRTIIQSVSDVHFKIVSELVQESYNKMFFILILYLTCSLVGILASCVGYVVLSRHTIKPIINLAKATHKISGGDLAIRVATQSETEIGTLYQSFNAMTAKLQEHERKREDFNRMLEQLVKKRTRELVESEESLRRTQSELVRMEKIATLGQIATSVNHEIKTPLNVLSMNLQLLIRKINQCPVEGEAMKQGMLDLTAIINNEIDRINGIVEEFVKYARFPPPEIMDNDLNRLLGDMAEMISQNAQDAEVAIELDLDDTLPPCPLDAKMMVQAILNLCMNAIQAMPYGGVLRIASKRLDDRATIRVADSGHGIPAADLDHIFDPFFTKKEGGLGFGLAIVQRIVEDHHGAILCESEEGRGTTFTITLPLPRLSSLPIATNEAP